MFNKILITMLVFTGVGVYANAPRKYTSCDTSSIQMPRGAAQIYFDEKCETVHVLPPRMGKATYKTANFSKARKCESMDLETQGYIEEMKILRAKLGEAPSESSANNSQSHQCKRKKGELSALGAQVSLVTSELETLNGQLTKVESDLSRCSGSACETLKYNKMTVESKIRSKQRKKNELSAASLSLENDVRVCSGNQDSSPSNLANDEREQILSRIQSLNARYLEALEPYDKEEGIVMHVTMENTHADLVQQFRDLNRGKKNKSGVEYNFIAMPVRATVHYYSKQIPNVNGQAVLATRIPGVAATFDFEDMNMVERSDPSDFVVLGSSLSGNVHFNLPTSCELLALDSSLQNLDAHLALNVVYTYQVQAGKEATISYKMDDIYEYMKKTSSKKRFFKSKTSVSVTELIKNNDTVKITIKNEDNSNAWNKDDIDFAMQLRANAMSLAFDSLEAKYTKETPDVIEPPAPAAGEVAKALRTIPVPIFQYGAVLIDSVNALFGGTEAQASYNRYRHTVVNETIEVDKPIVESGTYTFKFE